MQPQLCTLLLAVVSYMVQADDTDNLVGPGVFSPFGAVHKEVDSLRADSAMNPELVQITELLEALHSDFEKVQATTKAPAAATQPGEYEQSTLRGFEKIVTVGADQAPHSCDASINKYCGVDETSWMHCLGQHASDLVYDGAKDCQKDVGTSVPFICSNDIDKFCGDVNTGVLTCLENNLNNLDQKCGDAVKTTRGVTGLVEPSSFDRIGDGSSQSWFYVVTLQVFVLMAVVLFVVWLTGGDFGKDVLRQLLPGLEEKKEKLPLLAGPAKAGSIEITKRVGIIERITTGLQPLAVSMELPSALNFRNSWEHIPAGPTEKV